MSLTRDFLTLFRGNPDVAGLDDTGRGRPGPLRLHEHEVEQHWLVLAEGHLTDVLGIGVYPYNPARESVAWGCVDFDDGELDSWAHALNLHHALRTIGVRSWIERSRSKGYHVWVFSDWVAARWMRRLLIGACEAVSAPTREVNPKSNHLEPGQLGNFVRLPYKGWNKNRRITRQMIVDTQGMPISFMYFVSEALADTVRAEDLIEQSRIFRWPTEPRHVEPTVAEGPWIERLNGLARKQLGQGPKPEGTPEGNSGYLYGFGLACAESGLAKHEIEAALQLADEMHTHKYHHRKDAAARYEEIANKALASMEASP